MWSPGHPDRKIPCTDEATTTAWSPDGKLIAIGASNGTTYLLDESSGAEHAVLSKHQSTPRSIVWSPNQTMIATCSMDRTIRLWDALNGEFLFELTGHGDSVNDLKWTPRGDGLISASKDRTVRIWSLALRKETRVLEGHTGEVTGLGLSRDDQLLASRSNGAIHLWRTDSWEPVGILPESGMGCLMTGVAFDTKGDLLAAPGVEKIGDIEIWEVNAPLLIAATIPSIKVILMPKSYF